MCLRGHPPKYNHIEENS
jgi:hypothetical protein